MPLADLAGRFTGALLSPATFAVSLLRRARTFHPDGAVYRATVTPLAAGGPLGALAQRLQGEALVRLSSAWWRGGKEWTDVLGAAVRFRGKAIALHAPAWDGDQDLLAATIRSPWTMLLAPLTTLQHDFLANDFYAVSPFELRGAGRAKLRLRSLRHDRHAPDPGEAGLDRGERLALAVREGRATLRLEARALPEGRGLLALLAGALRGTALDRAAQWTPLADIKLVEPFQLDQARLRFSPFRDGRGLRPVGFVHALRAATYALSQLARPRHAQRIAAGSSR